MARREQSSVRKTRAGQIVTSKDACTPTSSTRRVVQRSIKTGEFTRTEIKKAIRKVTSERSAEC